MRHGAISLSIDSRLDDVFLVGRSVRAICRDTPLDEQAAADVELSVVEAVNNAIEHGYRQQPGHRVEVGVTLGRERLTIEVVDRGAGMDWDAEVARADAAAEADPLTEGGRGLLIMRALMDVVTYRREADRNVLTMVKELANGTPR